MKSKKKHNPLMYLPLALYLALPTMILFSVILKQEESRSPKITEKAVRGK